MRFILTFLIIIPITTITAQHSIPKDVQKEVETALRFYPELEDTQIEFRFKKNIKKSTMQARPTFWSLFKSRKNRKYLVLISRKFKISGKQFRTEDIEDEILIGWFGHELGHIMDYRHRSGLSMVWFGIKYTFSDKYIKEVERSADTFAVAAGMGEYILKTKRFILNKADIAEHYKDRIKKYYLSPTEILNLVNELEEETDAVAN